MNRLEVIRKIDSCKLIEDGVVTVGTFDGIHLAHQEIINRVIEKGKELNAPTTLVTFDPHPKLVVKKNGGYSIKILTTTDEKADILNDFAIDRIVVVPFTKDFSRKTPKQFVSDILCDTVGMQYLIVGFDHAFGKNREGDIESLREFGKTRNFDVEVQESIDDEKGKVSSTRIRNRLLEGNVEKAYTLLGRPYQVRGKVVDGAGRGKTLEFPTANIEVGNEHKCIPANGVYIVQVLLDDRKINGVMNIGQKPTFNEKNVTLEIHLLDFDENIYDKLLKVNFLARIRAEKKFDNVEELKSAIHSDVGYSRNFFNKKSIT
ncbi:MAG: bifunctional riboflavin kinase/FAD synthetase [bacterium]|nr:bifunctional riboflavin kinase/FAD synthetase [bacterium]